MPPSTRSCRRAAAVVLSLFYFTIQSDQNATSRSAAGQRRGWLGARSRRGGGAIIKKNGHTKVLRARGKMASRLSILDDDDDFNPAQGSKLGALFAQDKVGA